MSYSLEDQVQNPLESISIEVVTEANQYFINVTDQSVLLIFIECRLEHVRKQLINLNFDLIHPQSKVIRSS